MDARALFSAYRGTVTPEAADYNGHMNIAAFPVHFEAATRLLFEHLDVSRTYRERSNKAFFALEQHLGYERELRLGVSFCVATQLLAARPKLLRIMHFMLREADGEVAATSEILFVHVDLAIRRSAVIPDPVMDRISCLERAHAALPWPARAGAGIRIR